MVLAGALPFGAVFIELFFILESLFENEFYYMFGMDLLFDSDALFVRRVLIAPYHGRQSKSKTGFLFLVFVIVIIAVAQISIVLVYYQLCNEGESQPACPGR